MIRLLIFILSICCLSACTSVPKRFPPQNARPFFPGNQRMISASEQQIDANNYLNHYFSPWTGKNMVMTQEKAYDAEIQLTKKFLANPGVGENRQPHTQAWIKNIIENMKLQAPTQNTLAITLRSTSERLLPSDEPIFNHWATDVNSMEGYPFDRLQVSYLNANIPVRVIATSADGAWKLIINLESIGWVHTSDLANVDDAFIHQWHQKNHLVFMQDNVAVKNSKNQFYFYGRIGNLLPIKKITATQFDTWVAISDEHHEAQLTDVVIDKTNASLWPLPLTTKNFANAMNLLLGKPYGWGGMYGFRDCSLATMSLFAPFGIWLPRNSHDQAEAGHWHTSLNHLSYDEMQKIVQSKTIPGLTLLGIPGHEGVFLQFVDGHITAFHSMWGEVSSDEPYGESVISRFYLKHMEHEDFTITNLA